MEDQDISLPPPPDIVEYLHQLAAAQCTHVPFPQFIQSEQLMGGPNMAADCRQLLCCQLSTVNTTLQVDHDLTFKEVQWRDDTGPAPSVWPAGSPSSSESARDVATRAPVEEWLTMAPGMDAGLDLPPEPAQSLRFDPGPVSTPGFFWLSPESSEQLGLSGRSSTISSTGTLSAGTSSAGASSAGISSAGTSSAGTSSTGTSSAGTSSTETLSAGISSASTSSAGTSSAGTSSTGTSSVGTSSAGTSSGGTSVRDASSDAGLTLCADEVDQALQAEELTWPVLESAPARPPPADTRWARWVDPDQLPADLPADPAMRFEFELDPFQKQAVALVEKEEHILVAAHTSAGKTVIAEYAIARAMQNDARVIYTSPVKALSNQKYHELRRRFDDVGLLTGDTQRNMSARCLICTTEILRSMLYNRPQLAADLHTVVFDEVHYVSDQQRGHIWEECIIQLAGHVNLIMLSATVSNAMDFAEWVGSTKQRHVFVVTSPRRPVPLEHHLYVRSVDGQLDEQLAPRCHFAVLDENGCFSETEYWLAVKASQDRRPDGRRVSQTEPDFPQRRRQGSQRRRVSQTESDSPQRRRHGSGQRVSQAEMDSPQRLREIWHRQPSRPAVNHAFWVELVRHLEKYKLLPAIVFVLARQRCDSIAAGLTALDLTSDGEKQRIQHHLRDFKAHLTAADLALDTVRQMEDCLKRGLGVHHGGMLPFLKEIVEMLFQDGLVKVLFATETFATGINMPTRTVVFESLWKWDGNVKRLLLPAEYIQMSGRAGRRGRDSSGTAIIVCPGGKIPNKAELQAVISARPDRLHSRFQLTFFMLLNLLAGQHRQPTGQLTVVSDVVQCSFAVWRHSSTAEVDGNLQRKRRALRELGVDLSEDQVEECFEKCNKLNNLLLRIETSRWEGMANSARMEPGQVVVIGSASITRRLAVVLKVPLSEGTYCLRALIVCQTSRHDDWRRTRYDMLVLSEPKPEPGSEPESEPEPLVRRVVSALSTDVLTADGGSSHALLSVALCDIQWLVDFQIPVNASVADDIRQRGIPRFANCAPAPTCAEAVSRLTQLSANYPVDCVKKQLSHGSYEKPYEPLELRLLRTQLRDLLSVDRTSTLTQAVRDVLEVRGLQQEVAELSHWSCEAAAMVDVLRTLGFANHSGRATHKGRVSCGVGFRMLLVTELVFSHALAGLRPAELAALLSTLSQQQSAQRSTDPAGLPTQLRPGCEKLLNAARRIDLAQKKASLTNLTEEENSLDFSLVPAVYYWALGHELRHLPLPDSRLQGDLSKTLQRLDETLRDVRDLALHLSMRPLLDTVRDALAAIRRGIPFSPSLYTIGQV